MDASTAHHTFGRRTKNTIPRTARMCRGFTDFRTAFLQLPADSERYVRRIVVKSARTRTQSTAYAALIANAGDALKMNRAAVIAMKMAATTQITTRLYAGSRRRGICPSMEKTAAPLMPNVNNPNDRIIWDIPGD